MKLIAQNHGKRGRPSPVCSTLRSGSIEGLSVFKLKAWALPPPESSGTQRASFGGAVVMKVGTGGQVLGAVTRVGCLGVIRKGTNGRRKPCRRQKGAHSWILRHDSPVPSWLIGRLGTWRPLLRNLFPIKPVGHV
ncbi:hypothetical protein EMIT0P294_10930 [Pseudomonas sp. IT-P294]